MTATLLRSNHNNISVSLGLGELLHVNPQTPWHSAETEYRLQFERGSIEMPRNALVWLVRRATEALACAPTEPDCSGACAEVTE